MGAGSGEGGKLNVRRGVAALALGHGVNDFYMGFLPSLLPLLAQRLSLTYGAVGSLVTLVTVWTHVAQPAIGYGADRLGRRYLVVAGPIITTLAMSSLGLMDSYYALLAALVVGHIGNAFFHPLAASLTGSISRGSGSSMAIFSAGGSLGYGLGSLAIVVLVEWLGLERMWIMVGFGLLAAAFMFSSLPPAVETTRTAAPAAASAAPRRWLGPLLILFAVVALRAAEATVITTFVPLLLSARGASLKAGGYAVLAYSLAGAVGGLVAGPLSRRLGRRWVTVLSLALTAPAFYLFLHTDGVLAVVCFLIAGAALFAGLPVNIVMAQQLLPRHGSTASGLVMGLAWGVGAFSAKIIGETADRLSGPLGPALGLQRALEYSLAMVVAAAVIALFLTGPRREEARPPDAGSDERAVASAMLEDDVAG